MPVIVDFECHSGQGQNFDRRTQPLLILVFLLGAGLWRWRVGWGQVRTARRLDPRAAVVERRVIRGGSQPLSNGGVKLKGLGWAPSPIQKGNTAELG